MFSWLFPSAPKNASLILTPDESGRKHVGFTSGASLTLTATEGETVQTVMDRFNTYRGPNEQITHLYTPNGTLLPFTTRIQGTLTAVVSSSTQ